MTTHAAYRLGDVAEKIGATLQGDPNTMVNGINSLADANAEQLSFLDNKNYSKFLAETKAAAVIITAENAPNAPGATLVVENAHVGFAKATALFNQIVNPPPGIHPTAVIGENSIIPDSVSIGAHAVIGPGAVIGENTIIGSYCSIQNNCWIGANCRLYDRVTLYYDTHIGDNVVIHTGTVIGSDGFGFANDKGKWVKVYQLGRVLIGNRVDIGANTTIDRGALQDTIIGDDVIIDNLVQIAHNVQIGKGCAIAACTGIAGSTKIGNYCMLGGSVTVNGHIEICDNVQVVGATSIYRSIDKPGVYASPTVAQPLQDWLRSIAIFAKLPALAKSLQKLEKLAEQHLNKS